MKLPFDIKSSYPLYSRYISVYNSLLRSDIPIVAEILDHIQKKQGKQLRPILTLVTACCCGFNSGAATEQPLHEAAAAIEILHNSTLIHDDVVDQSDMRRGQPTVNTLYGNKSAVLTGDYLLAIVMRILNKIDNNEVTRIINDAVSDTSAGELLQQHYCGHYDISQDIYFDIIHKKTASFIAACCEIGAVFATEDNAIRQAAHQFGKNIGIAFQIRDDILDYLPSDQTGKPQGNDLKEHKATLPLLLTLNLATQDDKKQILALLEREELSETDVETISRIASSCGALEQCREHTMVYLQKATEMLKLLPTNQYRDTLYEIIYLLKEI